MLSIVLSRCGTKETFRTQTRGAYGAEREEFNDLHAEVSRISSKQEKMEGRIEETAKAVEGQNKMPDETRAMMHEQHKRGLQEEEII